MKQIWYTCLNLMQKVVGRRVSEGSKVYTDSFRSYNGLRLSYEAIEEIMKTLLILITLLTTLNNPTQTPATKFLGKSPFIFLPHFSGSDFKQNINRVVKKVCIDINRQNILPFSKPKDVKTY